jgi:hypothetical protein
MSRVLENAHIVGGKTVNQIRRLEGTFSTEGTVCTKEIYVPLHLFYVLDIVCRMANAFLNIKYSFN